MALTASVIVYTELRAIGTLRLYYTHTVSANSMLLLSVLEYLLHMYFDLLKFLFYRLFFDNFESLIGILDSSKSLMFKMEMLHVED